MTPLSKEEKERRILLVIYRLSQGSPGILIQKDNLLKEINKLGVMEMSEAEFEQFHTDSVNKFKKVTKN